MKNYPTCQDNPYPPENEYTPRDPHHIKSSDPSTLNNVRRDHILSGHNLRVHVEACSITSPNQSTAVPIVSTSECIVKLAPIVIECYVPYTFAKKHESHDHKLSVNILSHRVYFQGKCAKDDIASNHNISQCSPPSSPIALSSSSPTRNQDTWTPNQHYDVKPRYAT